MLTPLFDRLENWHSTRFARPWLGPLPMTRGLILAALVMALIAVFANVNVRYDQGQIWKANPEITEIAGAMSFSTTDAPFFLGHAATLEKGMTTYDYHRKRTFPNAERAFEQGVADAPKLPFLSTLISWVSPSAEPSDLLNAGHTILLINVGFTALMIILAFAAAGYWLEGAAAAVGGGLSTAYLVRSSFGRIDTDQLNLGLLYLMFALVVFSARSKNTISALIYALGAGATAKFLMVWYGKQELIWMAMIAYIWLLFCLRKQVRVALACLLIFFSLAPISLPQIFGSPYLADTFGDASFIFPNTLETISEVRKISVAEILKSATGSVEMGIVCLFGLVLWAIRHPIIAVAYGPLAGFALLNFVVGNRAVFYSAPMFWFGMAFLLTSTTRFVIQELTLVNIQTSDGKIVEQFAKTNLVSTVAASAALIVAWVNSPTEYLPRPSFPKTILEGFENLREIVRPDQSVVATWWDYGYASIFLNNLPTLHDGGSQTTPITYFVARSLLASDQTEMIETLRFLVTQGKEDIRNYDSKDALLAAVTQPKSGSVRDVYLVLTSQMAGWIGSISQLGNWDIETGQPVIPKNNNGTPRLGYIGLRCGYNGFPAQLQCNNISLDFNRGLLNGEPNIVGWTRAIDGFAKDVRRYKETSTFGVQTLQTNNRLSSQLMHRQLYDSSFNKLYHLGLIEAPGITLVYDDYPHIRIYRIAGMD